MASRLKLLNLRLTQYILTVRLVLHYDDTVIEFKEVASLVGGFHYSMIVRQYLSLLLPKGGAWSAVRVFGWLGKWVRYRSDRLATILILVLYFHSQSIGGVSTFGISIRLEFYLVFLNIQVAHRCGSLWVYVARVVGVRSIGLEWLPVLVKCLIHEVTLSLAMTSVWVKSRFWAKVCRAAELVKYCLLFSVNEIHLIGRKVVDLRVGCGDARDASVCNAVRTRTALTSRLAPIECLLTL